MARFLGSRICRRMGARIGDRAALRKRRLWRQARSTTIAPPLVGLGLLVASLTLVPVSATAAECTSGGTCGEISGIIKLNATGRRLLEHAHGRLKVTVAVIYAAAGKTTTTEVVIRLRSSTKPRSTDSLHPDRSTRPLPS